LVILSVAMHKPKGPHEETNFLKSLKEYGDVQRKFKGHLSYSIGKDEKDGVLIVVSIWANQEDMMAAMGEMTRFRQTFDFRANQVGPTRYYQGSAEFVEIGLK